MPWKLASLNAEGVPVQIQGTDIWKHEWKTQGEAPVEAQHPGHSRQSHALTRYFVQAEGKIIQFAAGEVSPGVWLIYQPEERSGPTSSFFPALSVCCFAVSGLAFRFGEMSESKTLVAIALGLAGGVALAVVSFSRRSKSEA